MSEPLVIIGNGMAAARLVEEMAKRAKLGESSDDNEMEVDESESNSEMLK